MSDLASGVLIAKTILEVASAIPELYEDIRELLAAKHPELLPAPPESQESAIRAEDTGAITQRFGSPTST